MHFKLRPLDIPDDFPRMAALISAVNPEPVTVRDLQEWEQTRPTGEGTYFYRVAAVDEAGYLIGYAEAVHFPWNKLGKFYTWVVVDANARRHGIGTALLNDIEAYARQNGALLLDGECRDNSAEGQAFAEQYGYKQERHIFESTLDLAKFDDAQFAGVVDGVRQSGIRFFTLADEPGEANERKLYETMNRNVGDIPGWDNVSHPSFEQWRKWNIEGEDVRPDLILIAAEGDQFAGITTMQPVKETGAIYTHHTSVCREFRGRKVALALKLLAVEAARRYKAPYMRTNNDSLNGPMLAVNWKMGYQKAPGIYRLRKQI